MRKTKWRETIKSITLSSVYMKHQKYHKAIEDKDVKTSRMSLPFPKGFRLFLFETNVTRQLVGVYIRKADRGQSKEGKGTHKETHQSTPATKNTSEFLRRRACL